MHIELKDSDKGNCIPLEDISILNCSSALDLINATSSRQKLCDDFDESEDTDEYLIDHWLFDESSTELSNQITTYIAGNVIKYLSKKLKCEECVEELHATEVSSSHRFVQYKDEGGLAYPAKDVIAICKKSSRL